VSNLLMAKCHARYCGLVCGLQMEKITVSGIRNCQNYSVIVLVYIHYTNVFAGNITLVQPGGLQVGAPCVKSFAVRYLLVSCWFLAILCMSAASGIVVVCFCPSLKRRAWILWCHFCNLRTFKIEVICMWFVDPEGLASVCHNVKLGYFHRLTFKYFFYWIMLQIPPRFGMCSPVVYLEPWICLQKLEVTLKECPL
jgi:hypothetical protein